MTTDGFSEIARISWKETSTVLWNTNKLSFLKDVFFIESEKFDP